MIVQWVVGLELLLKEWTEVHLPVWGLINKLAWILFDTSMGCRLQPTFLKGWTKVHFPVCGLFHKQAGVLFDTSISCRLQPTFLKEWTEVHLPVLTLLDITAQFMQHKKF